MNLADLIPPRYGEVARAQRVTEGNVQFNVALLGIYPTTMLRMVPLPVPGRNW